MVSIINKTGADKKMHHLIIGQIFLAIEPVKI